MMTVVEVETDLAEFEAECETPELAPFDRDDPTGRVLVLPVFMAVTLWGAVGWIIMR